MPTLSVCLSVCLHLPIQNTLMGWLGVCGLCVDSNLRRGPDRLREHIDAHSYSWCLMRYAIIKHTNQSFRAFLPNIGMDLSGALLISVFSHCDFLKISCISGSPFCHSHLSIFLELINYFLWQWSLDIQIFGFCIDWPPRLLLFIELPMRSPLVHSIVKNLEIWEEQLRAQMDAFSGPPNGYIPGCSVDSSLGVNIVKYSALANPSHTPFLYVNSYFYFDVIYLSVFSIS